MELQPQWRQMMESKYSKFLMGKLIRYCPSIRPLLIPTLSQHLTSLLFHADASQPLSDFFDLWASSKERKLLVRGFYPKEVQIFDGLKVKGKGVNVDGEVKGLEGALEDMGDEGKGRERVLNDIEKTIADVYVAFLPSWSIKADNQIQRYSERSSSSRNLSSTSRRIP